MPKFSSRLKLAGPLVFFFVFFSYACRAPSFSSAQELSVTNHANGIRLQVVPQDTLPALKIILPGRPASDPGILVLFPEHVTDRQHGKTDTEHLYLFRPGIQTTRPSWLVAGETLEYEMDLAHGVQMTARATLEADGIRFQYDFINQSKTAYDMIQAVTDPRMITPYFRDVRLERTYVHQSNGFDLLASETPSRFTMPLTQWLPSRYRVSFRWPVEPHRIEKKEDGITWYNKSRRADEPFIATKSVDGKWIMASFSRDPGNLWTNPELTCQHVDPETILAPEGNADLDLKILLFQGSLDDVLSKVKAQRQM